MKIVKKELKTKKDQRGWLVEIIRLEELKKKTFGQIMLTVAYPGQTRGMHHHKRKTEWYCVLKGQGRLSVVDSKTREKDEFVIGEENMIVVEIPPNYAHAITNIGKENMYLLVYVDEPFDESDPDTYKGME